MNSHSSEDLNRWEELHVAGLIFGLSVEEQAECDEISRLKNVEQLEQFDRLVGSLDVNWAGRQPEPLPEYLRSAIRLKAKQELAAQKVVPTVKHSSKDAIVVGRRQILPWLVSAACLALSVFLWISNDRAAKNGSNIAQLRAELIATDKNVLQAPWSAGTTPVEGATGDVVWSTNSQQGFMRFQGLPVNTPTKEQYQLWIFDKNQSDKTPVDGGVFNIETTGEVVVPIDAKLRVQEPFMFAITIEKPGGVVVSSRERLPLLAKVE